jgi:hypothetical protein
VNYELCPRRHLYSMMAVLALVLLLRRKDLVQLTSRFLFTVRSVLLCMYAMVRAPLLSDIGDDLKS